MIKFSFNERKSWLYPWNVAMGDLKPSLGLFIMIEGPEKRKLLRKKILKLLFRPCEVMIDITWKKMCLFDTRLGPGVMNFQFIWFLFVWFTVWKLQKIYFHNFFTKIPWNQFLLRQQIITKNWFHEICSRFFFSSKCSVWKVNFLLNYFYVKSFIDAPKSW